MKRDEAERELRELSAKTDRELGKAKQVRAPPLTYMLYIDETTAAWLMVCLLIVVN